MSPLTISQTFLVYDDLDNVEYWSIFCRMLLNWGLSDVFVMVKLGLREGKHKDKVTFLSPYIKGTYYQHDL